MLTAGTERQIKDLLNETIGNLVALAETEAAGEHEQVLPCVPTVEVILLPTTWNGESCITVEQVSPLLCRAYLQSSSKVFAWNFHECKLALHHVHHRPQHFTQHDDLCH